MKTLNATLITCACIASFWIGLTTSIAITGPAKPIVIEIITESAESYTPAAYRSARIFRETYELELPDWINSEPEIAEEEDDTHTEASQAAEPIDNAEPPDDAMTPATTPATTPITPTVPTAPTAPRDDPRGPSPAILRARYAIDTAATPIRPWREIILHHSGSDESTVTGIEHWHVNGLGWRATGYHFIIERNGNIHVGERWRQQWDGAHCKGDGNKDGIGVCLIGNFDRAPPPDAQLSAAAALVDVLKSELSIETQNIIDHRDRAATACPGEHFNRKDLIERIHNVPAVELVRER